MSSARPNSLGLGRIRLGKAAEATLNQTGLIYNSNGLDEVHVSDDLRFSLRYSDDDHITREFGPLHQAAPCPARAAEADPGPVGWAMPVGGGSHRPGPLPRTLGPYRKRSP